ncbi:mannose-1-phosphate guanylyltransferase/mannose-6-phosphate isomerase [Devosia nitrariae]|uniref:mannose-1-phosphate guanylyltransferase n=1 Tax=Devosia nitrariae TaxID=2071872 RepID=A0ABQ5W1A3_9HYPH|nr:mannose-1-phosphate guanylyltransferase/mannose-6-phosphate isomerase [Devosia nitrariae]GLQ53659.1 mannose-1-phosphate guanylyltransferase [Devosia nitrariae]
MPNRKKIVPVVLAGGQGTRLWPLSRSVRPKQFLNLNGDVSLFQQALLRVLDDRYAAPIVITNSEYRFLVAEQAQEMGIALAAIMLEPVVRNTAPAIAAASVLAESKFGGDPILHILASDHAIDVDDEYWHSIDTARTAAEGGMLVTFGVVPTVPETGYGYIEAGEPTEAGALQVVQFIEKPDAVRAQDMLERGGYFWNSGMFVFSARTFLDEAEALAPDVVEHAGTAVVKGVPDLDFFRLEEESFAQAPNISIDYAVLEKSDKVAVVAVGYRWSDLGSWDAVWKIADKDEAGNVAHQNVSLTNTQRSLVLSDHAHVVVDGLEDVAVIVSEDAVYVGRLSNAQQVGSIVKRLRANPATAALTETHQTAYRPWGGYSSVLMGGRFQVKRLFVKPGKKLSLQKHHHRAEHWVVVSGTAEVTVDGEMKTLTENQSIYLPLGCVHRLANPGKILLELIEVQTGSYLGEDDIVRIDDDFGRA